MSQFRSSLMAQRWAELHKQRQALLDGKLNEKIEDKIDVLTSLMSACKTGFLLPDPKIKKALKFIKQHTGKKRAKYGLIPDGLKTNTILFSSIVLVYVEKEDQIIFREHVSEK